MNVSGEAADQVVRMALQTGEVALKITGQGAKQLAALLYAILKGQKKTKGRTRLESMVRTGKPLTVFSVRESDVKEFVKDARRYGVLYCAVRNPRRGRDGMVDMIVREEDASRINRIVERFKFASVREVAKIQTETMPARSDKGRAVVDQKKPLHGQAQPERGIPEKSEADKLADELLSAPVRKDGEKSVSPFPQMAEKSRLSEPTSGRPVRTAEGTSKRADARKGKRNSVRKELRAIQESRKGSGSRQNTVRHRRPKQKKRTKMKAR